MFKSFFKTAWRNFLMNSRYSAINIVGLAMGMTVALLIGLWVGDELSFNTYHRNYGRLAQVMDTQTINGEMETREAIAIPLAEELRNNYAGAFKHVALVYPNFTHTIAVGDKKMSASGVWAQPDFPEMLTLKMIKGSRDVLRDPSSVLITRSLARALFGEVDPMNRAIEVDHMTTVKVAGVFEDLPENTRFHGTKLILSWDKAFSAMPWLKDHEGKWDTRYWWLFVEMNERADIGKATAAIRDIASRHTKGNEEKLLLHPMSEWHLHDEFRNGRAVGGRIGLVRTFGIIGGFVLMLACINFMNLSTARSAKRAKEIGIRKTIGSLRGQLIGQFLCESVLVAFLALLLAIGMTLLSIPAFNQLTQKRLSIPYGQPLCWLIIPGFTLFTGLFAGSYPAFYLSAFRPVNVLKGSVSPGRLASLPRRILIVLQFAVSIILIIGTLTIYRQIQHAKDRPVGYMRTRLITISLNTPRLISHSPYNDLRDALLQTGVVGDVAKSSIHATETPGNRQDLYWEGQDPHSMPPIGVVWVTHDFGNTIGWHVRDGRDFSRRFATDTGSIILNEAAARLTGFPHPVGRTIRFDGKDRMITGVVDDMVMESPYKPVQPTIFQLDYGPMITLTVRILPNISIREALSKIESTFSKQYPEGVFDYQFTDEEYAAKFANEELISNLAIVFTLLAIFISCLGLFGLASFTAEQRTKEIGVRKVLGASVVNVWVLLSKDFVGLVLLSFLIASPVAYYFMHRWLENYVYRTTLSWWIFVWTGAGVLVITLLTVSYQSIRAALMNPVKSLRTE